MFKVLCFLYILSIGLAFDIDFIIIDTVHFMPGEFLTFLTALPQLKDGCIVVLHDIHLNMVGFEYIIKLL